MNKINEPRIKSIKAINSSVFLVLYSTIYDKEEIACALSIQKNLSSRSFLYITQDKESILNAHPFPRKNLPDALFLDYTYNDTMKKAMNDGVCILFDDLSTLLETTITDRFEKNLHKQSTIIIIAPETIHQKEIERIESRCSNIFISFFSFTHNPLEVQHKKLTIPISTIQEKHYEKKLLWEKSCIARLENKENTTEKDENRLYKARNSLYSRPTINFVYPEDIQNVYDSRGNVVYNIPPDIDINKHGWVTRNIISILHRLSPKMVKLFTNILVYRNVKQVVYTSYYDHHGALIINTILSYLNISSVIYRKDDKMIDNFNDSVYNKVLILTTIPNKNIENVYKVHFFDNYTLDNIKHLESKIVKRKNYTLIVDTLQFFYYVGVSDKLVTIDEDMYKEYEKIDRKLPKLISKGSEGVSFQYD